MTLPFKLSLFLVVLSMPIIFLLADESHSVPKTDMTSIKLKASKSSRLDAARNETMSLTLMAKDRFNEWIDLDADVELIWSVDNDHVEIDSKGNVLAKSPGKSTVKVNLDEIEAEVEVLVWDSSEPRVEVFISDAGENYKAPWQILRSFDDGSYTEVFTNESLSWPQDILVLEDQGIALVSNLSANNITKYNLSDGAYEGEFYVAISGPTRMQIGPDGLIYVLQWTGDGLVKRFRQDGAFVDSFTNVQISQSIGIAWDSKANLYVSTYSTGDGGSFVQKFDIDGNNLGKFIKEGLQGATNIWFEGSDLMVHDYPQGIIKRFDQDGTFVENHITGLNQPEGIGRLPDGNILIGNGGTGAIKMYNREGEFIKDYLPSGEGGLKKPNAVVVRSVN